MKLNPSVLALSSFALAAVVIVGTATRNVSAQSDAVKPDPAGQKIFSVNCVACHGDDGAGSPVGQALGAKDLRSKEVQDMSDDDLRKVITNGNGSMPAWGSTLKPDDITAVITVVRSLKATAK